MTEAERHADDLDRAAFISEMHNQNRVQEIRLSAMPEQKCVNGVWETEFCVDCGELIEPQRLSMGKVRCVHCQTVLEKRRRRGL